MNEEAFCCVYLVLYPKKHQFDGLPCYVGQGTPDRPRRDFRTDGNTELSDLARQTGEPLRVLVVQEGLTRRESLKLEAKLIRFIRRRPGSAPLFNRTVGGLKVKSYKPDVSTVKLSEVPYLAGFITGVRKDLVEGISQEWKLRSEMRKRGRSDKPQLTVISRSYAAKKLTPEEYRVRMCDRPIIPRKLTPEEFRARLSARSA